MKTVLIIDDDPHFGELVSAILRKQHWKVFSASEGEEGITLARLHRPDVVLCDLLMPRCNGFQVCRALRADSTFQNTRIIVTSGRSFDADRQAAFAAGANEYLTKPFESAQLLRLLGSIGTETNLFEKKVVTTFSAETLTSGPTQLKFWGVRGSIPTPGPGTVEYGGNTSCIEIRAEGQIIILDAGSGLRLLGRELLEEFKDQPLNLTLLLTHTHWDHIQGLPFFRPLYKTQNHLRILGYEGARHGLGNVLSSQMENPFFPVSLQQLPANVEITELKEMEFNIGNVQVEACFANHPGICVGYRLFTPSGSVAFFPDNEPLYVADSADSKASLEYAQGVEQKMVEFLHGTDVLIMDSQYDREEYQQHVGWGHACLDDVVALAIKAEVKKLFLFHHDPDHDDAKVSAMAEHARKLAAAQKSNLQIEAAREGAVVELAKV
jgi:phosphoribosyl 1,2-cyclic phosphodiesterase/ActR/RegA family two-component response regulator